MPVIKCTAAQGAVLPAYQSAGAAGADICAFLEHDVLIEVGCRAMIPTGLSFEIPNGFEIQVRPRSGLAAKAGITCLNSPGTIDSDYRGEIKAILINHGDKSFTVKNGDRIAQIVVCPVVQVQFLQTDELSQTERGAGGFGSTGI